MKRKQLSAEDKEKLNDALAVPGVSENATKEIWNRLHKKDGKEISSTSFKRHVTSFLKPAAACFRTHELAGQVEGTIVHFALAHLPHLVEYVGKHMPNLANLLVEALDESGGVLITPLLYHDEATGGNVILIGQKKATLVYLSWKELGAMLHLEDCWLTVAIMQHCATDKLPAGFSTCMPVLAKHLFADDWLNGFAVNLTHSGIIVKETHQSAFFKKFLYHCHQLCSW